MEHYKSKGERVIFYRLSFPFQLYPPFISLNHFFKTKRITGFPKIVFGLYPFPNTFPVEEINTLDSFMKKIDVTFFKEANSFSISLIPPLFYINRSLAFGLPIGFQFQKTEEGGEKFLKINFEKFLTFIKENCQRVKIQSRIKEENEIENLESLVRKFSDKIKGEDRILVFSEKINLSYHSFVVLGSRLFEDLTITIHFKKDFLKNLIRMTERGVLAALYNLIQQIDSLLIPNSLFSTLLYVFIYLTPGERVSSNRLQYLTPLAEELKNKGKGNLFFKGNGL